VSEEVVRDEVVSEEVVREGLSEKSRVKNRE
jgi:hypothetical protein